MEKIANEITRSVVAYAKKTKDDRAKATKEAVAKATKEAEAKAAEESAKAKAARKDAKAVAEDGNATASGTASACVEEQPDYEDDSVPKGDDTGTNKGTSLLGRVKRVCGDSRNFDIITYSREDKEKAIYREHVAKFLEAEQTMSDAKLKARWNRDFRKKDESELSKSEKEYIMTKVRKELSDKSRNRCGVMLTILFPFLLVAWAIGLSAQEIWFRPGSLDISTAQLTEYAPLMLKVSCLLEDAGGRRNPICAGMSASGMVDMFGMSLLQPFTDGETLCTSGSNIKRKTTARDADPDAPLSDRFSAYYNVQLEPWEGAGAALGNTTFEGPTTCDATAANGTLAGGRSVTRKYRLLGVFPICPFSQSMQLGAWTASSPVGGLGFVLETPILGKADLSTTVEGKHVALTWDVGGCLHDGFVAEIQPSTDGRLQGLGFSVPIQVNFTDESSRPMNQASSQYATWTRDGDISDRMPLVEYSLTMDHTLKKGFIGDPNKLNDVKTLQNTIQGGVVVQDVMRARAFVTPADLRAATINHMFWQKNEACVNMQTCGERLELPVSTYDEYALAVKNAGDRVHNLGVTNNATVAAAVLDFILGKDAQQIARDVGWNASQLANASAVSELYRLVSVSVPSSVASEISSLRVIDADSDSKDQLRKDTCAQTYRNRTAWQRLSSGCGFTCNVPIAGHQLNVSAQKIVDSSGRDTVLVYLQRSSLSLVCGVDDSDTGSINAYTPTLTVPDGGVFRLRGDENGGREFIRGPATVLAIVFRSNEVFTTIKENFSTLTPMSIFTQTMGMSGTFFAILLLVKVIWDLGPFKNCCRKGGSCSGCVAFCCPTDPCSKIAQKECREMCNPCHEDWFCRKGCGADQVEGTSQQKPEVKKSTEGISAAGAPKDLVSARESAHGDSRSTATGDVESQDSATHSAESEGLPSPSHSRDGLAGSSSTNQRSLSGLVDAPAGTGNSPVAV